MTELETQLNEFTKALGLLALRSWWAGFRVGVLVGATMAGSFAAGVLWATR